MPRDGDLGRGSDNKSTLKYTKDTLIMEMLNYALGTKKFFEGLEGELYVFKIMDDRFTSRAKDTKRNKILMLWKVTVRQG